VGRLQRRAQEVPRPEEEGEVAVPNARGQNVVAARRRVDAAELRARGKSYREIGAALGVSHTQAENDVRAGLKALQGDLVKKTAQLVQLELVRLELPLSMLVERIAAGDLDALEQWRKLSDARRKLLGLDAPEKHHVTRDYDDEIARILAQLAGQGEGEAPQAPAGAGGGAAGGDALPGPPGAEGRPESHPLPGGDDAGPVAGGAAAAPLFADPPAGGAAGG
jgi:hypothetical protein